MTINNLNTHGQVTVLPIPGHKGPLALLQVSPYRARGRKGWIVQSTELGRRVLPSFWRWWLQTLLAGTSHTKVIRDQGGVAVMNGKRDPELVRAFVIERAIQIRAYSKSQLPLERRDPLNLPNADTAAEWRLTQDNPAWYNAIDKVATQGLTSLSNTASFYWWTSKQMYYGVAMPVHDGMPAASYGTAATKHIWPGPYTGAVLVYPQRIAMEKRHELAEHVEYIFFREFCRENT